MEKPLSFSVDHSELNEGLYVSRVDYLDAKHAILTLDLRMVSRKSLLRRSLDNDQQFLVTLPSWYVKKYGSDFTRFAAGFHTIEHCLATVFRNNSQYKPLYCGPGGCLTMFYLVFAVDSLQPWVVEDGQAHFVPSPKLVFEVRQMLQQAKEMILTNNVPGLLASECGNPKLHDFEVAVDILVQYQDSDWDTHYTYLTNN